MGGEHAVAASSEDWRVARLKLLEKEKKHTRERDLLSQKRQALPWLDVTSKKYSFLDRNNRELELKDLFGKRSQLIVVHHAFGKDWEQGSKSCAFLADM